MSNLAHLFAKASKVPGGAKAFSIAVCQRAPFFGSISPTFVALKPGYSEIKIRNQRKVRNHIGTVHAIAMCNMAELAGGTVTDVSIPKSMRWIPKGMQVEYLKKAETKTLRAEARPQSEAIEGQKQDFPVVVEIKDDNDQVVCRCVITMQVSPKS